MINGRFKKPLEILVFSLALHLFLPFSAVLFSVQEVIAETRYVKPSAEIVVRRGQGTEYKIVGLVKDGDVVELLKESDSYAMVRLADGKEGWMVKRFLSVNPPMSTVVAGLRDENEKMKQREIELSQQFEEVSAALRQTETDLNAVLAERNQISTDYQNLQQDTADVIRIKEDMLNATQENDVLAQKLASLQEENKDLSKDTSINWFLAGGGVLLVGMFIGRLSSKSRRRKSSLM
ncbi:MAG: TIGR04211 family SH3 domain-containing protein [Desulforhopalus sp.]